MTHFIDPSGKLLYHLDRIAAIQAGEKPAPVNVEVDLSNRCNLMCQHCHFSYTHSRGPWARAKPQVENGLDMGDLMDTPLAISLIDELAAFGVRSLTWTGGGEPTLHPRFDQIVEHAAGKIDQGLYTNGTLISANRAALLKRALAWVYVSLDAASAEDYERAKQVNKFRAACAGIENLARASGSATIGVGFLLNRDNWQRGARMIQLARELGADYCQFRPQIDFDLANPGARVGSAEWVDPCVAWLETVRAADVIADTERFAMYRDWNGHGYPACYWTQMQTVITPNGKVWRCVNRRGFPGDCIGDLNDESFAAIWERSGAFAVNEHCRTLCRGHLPNRALTGLLGEKPEHWRFI